MHQALAPKQPLGRTPRGPSTTTATTSASSRHAISHHATQRVSVSTAAASVPDRHQQKQQQQQHQQQAPALAAAVAASVALLLCSSAQAAQAATAEANFGAKCVGCHVGGGNIIVAGATLFQDALVKNNVADSDSLYSLIYSGKGRMPGFGTECAPKAQCTFGPKLSDDEVRDLVQYVQDQAAAGWKPQQ